MDVLPVRCSFVALLGLSTAAQASPSPVAIYGGSIAGAKEGRASAYFVARRPGYSGSCSGILVEPTKVLTAGHCVRTRKGKKLKVRSVRLGNPRGKTVWRRVKAIHVDPQYDPTQPERGHDFAVLVLKSAPKGIEPVQMANPEDDPRQGDKVFVRGFGLTRGKRRLYRSTNRLRVAKLESLSPFACFSGPVEEMARTRMCAADRSAGVCPGDSGSGVVRQIGDRMIVVGTISVVLDQGQCQMTPAIMGRVSAVAGWVRSLDE